MGDGAAESASQGELGVELEGRGGRLGGGLLGGGGSSRGGSGGHCEGV